MAMAKGAAWYTSLVLLLLLQLDWARGFYNGPARSYAAFAALKSDGSVVAWGDAAYGGSTSSPVNSAASLTSGVASIFSTKYAFAGLKSDGSVVAWGPSSYGGSTSGVSGLTSGVVSIASTEHAFAALKTDGSVVAWGNTAYGGSTSAVSASLTSGVVSIASTYTAFAALKSDGRVVAWGDTANGGSTSGVSASLTSGVVSIFSTERAFAALKTDGSVVAWGDTAYGGSMTSPVNSASSLTSGVVSIAATLSAFAALKSDGSVVGWGDAGYGGSTSGVSGLTSGVASIFSTKYGFAVLKTGGSVVAWGPDWGGGVTTGVAASLTSGVVTIAATYTAFAALKTDGSVVAWGDTTSGGSLTWPVNSAANLTSGVVSIFSNERAFAALKTDGSVVAWGLQDYGGSTTTPVNSAASLTSGVVSIAATERAFAALKSDGSVVAWGPSSYGGSTSTPVNSASSLTSGVVSIFGQLVLRSGPFYTLSTPSPVAPGSNRQQVFYDSRGIALIATVTFSSITGSGATNLVQLATSSGAALPGGYAQLTPAVYYNITTTATFSGSIQVCLMYPTPLSTTPRLVHYTGGAWVDITATSNTTTRTVCGQTTSLSPFALASRDSLGSLGSAMSDPHLVGANGAKFDFDGQLGGAYVLFSAPQFQVNMRIAGDGPKPHFMTEVAVLFRGEAFLFTVDTMDGAFREGLETELARLGGRLISFKHWQVTMELCRGQRVTITQMHTTEAERELWHADGRPFYYLDVEVSVPGCHEAYGGVLGQTYQCKYVRDGAAFEWSEEQEEAFRLKKGLSSPSGTYAADAPCFAGASSGSKRGKAGRRSAAAVTGKGTGQQSKSMRE